MTDLSKLPECKYRRSTRHSGLERLHCFLKRGPDCTHEECAACSQAVVETGKRVPMELENGQIEEGYFYEVSDPNFAAMRLPLVKPEDLKNWIIEHSDEKRSDLQAIATPSPSRRPGKDRHFILNLDGSIEYEREEEEEWEPPRDIKGYQRDPDNLWRFIPLWPVCFRRIPRSYHSESCGCVEVAMKCLHIDSTVYDEDVSYQQCQQCLVRVEQKGD